MKIIGTGAYVPEKIITNDDLSTMVETSDEWITQRVGVKERRVSVNETAADFGVEAAKKALLSANISAEDLDLIIVSTITGETLCPTTAALIQKAIGATCPAFDMQSACSGFMFALDTADSFISSGKGYKNVLVVATERMSKILDWTDRSTCVIFGDGAGAAVVTEGDGYLASSLYTKGDDEVLYIPSCTKNSPFFEKEYADTKVFMNGSETFNFAVRKIVDDIKEVAEKAGISVSDIDYIVSHQANIRIISYASKRLGIPMEKFVVNIDKYGNTSSASVPMALDDLVKEGKLKDDDIIAMCAFGGGLSSSACIIKWSK
ncbi:MAG: beta-ketoacyl-ACP synthase III [Oscillospiraceae bacterium]